MISRSLSFCYNCSTMGFNNTTAGGGVSRSFQTVWTLENIFYHAIAAFTVLAIIVTNSLAVKCIRSKVVLTRANLLFLILTISDMGVGIFSIPIILLHLNTRKIPLQLFRLFLEFPYTFSWYMTILIALDRCLIVTRQKRYQSIVTRKILVRLICSIFIIDFVVSVVVSIKGYDTLLVAIPCQLFLIFTTCCSYIHLAKYVHKNATRMKYCSRTYKLRHMKKLTRTIFLIFMFQIVFTLPMFVGLIVLKAGHTTVRKAAAWLVLLQYSNCHGNAIIFLVNQRNLKKSISPAGSMKSARSRSTISTISTGW